MLDGHGRTSVILSAGSISSPTRQVQGETPTPPVQFFS